MTKSLEEFAEILMVYSEMNGNEYLAKMLRGEWTIDRYLEHVEQSAKAMIGRIEAQKKDMDKQFAQAYNMAESRKFDKMQVEQIKAMHANALSKLENDMNVHRKNLKRSQDLIKGRDKARAERAQKRLRIYVDGEDRVKSMEIVGSFSPDEDKVFMAEYWSTSIMLREAQSKGDPENDIFYGGNVMKDLLEIANQKGVKVEKKV